MNINKEQENIVNFVKSEISKLHEKKIDLAKTAYSYFATFGKTIGLAKINLNRFPVFGLIEYFVTIFKDNLNLIRSHSLEIINESKHINQRILLISNASLKDFNNNGHYFDRYFRINSNDYKNIIFILHYLESEIPSKIEKNIILFRNKRNNFFNGLIFFLKEKFKSKNYETSSYSNFAEKICELIKKNINILNLEKVIIPYEGQPFQQSVFAEVKMTKKEIETIGYDHSVPHSLPLNLFFRTGAPDTLIVNSKSQFENSVNFLNWPQERVKLAPSLRYQKNDKEDFKNKIFFPYQIFNPKIVLNEFNNFLSQQEDFSLNKLDIKMHPVSPFIDKQKKLKNELLNIMNKYGNKFNSKNSNKDTSIFIGATTAIIVALEKNIRVFHLCTNPILDSYSNYMWPKLRINYVSQYIFEYKVDEKNNFLTFGDNSEQFNNHYINN